MARKARRTRPGDVANAFVRCLLSDAGQMLGGLTEEQWTATLEYFDYRCPYSDSVITSETAVQDHAIPISKKHCGLHLYGNVLPCTAEANSEKHHRHYRDYVVDPQRLERIETFIDQSGYWTKAAMLGDLQACCETQYEVVTGLCARNQDYLLRMVGSAPGELSDDDEETAGREVLHISLHPAPATVFKDRLLRTKIAWITIHYEDGTKEVSEWQANSFKPSSNVLGNLRSRPAFRQGEWQRRGIARLEVSIDRPDGD